MKKEQPKNEEFDVWVDKVLAEAEAEPPMVELMKHSRVLTRSSH
jgi:hypothetical protein